jgi:hypothetical protein
MDILPAQPLFTQFVSALNPRHLILLSVILVTGATTSPAGDPVAENDRRRTWVPVA